MAYSVKSVLIIEDDHDIRVALRQVLEAAGFKVFSAANGLNAFDLLKVIPLPDLFICDLKMPLMDGESFINMKKQDSKIRNIPIIIMSAYKEKLCHFPEVQCLSKPLDMDMLVKAAEKAVLK